MTPASDNFVKRYCGLYALYFIGGTVLLAVISAIINWDSSSAMSFVIAMIAAHAPGDKFARDYGRLPEKQEKRRFSIICTLIAVLLPLLPTAVLFGFLTAEERAAFFAPYANVPVWIWLATIPVALLVCYWLIGWGFSIGAKRVIKHKAAEEAGRP